MKPDPIVLRVFLSSPGDVQNERQIAYDEIRKFSYSKSSDAPQFYLQAVGWDRPWKRIPIEANRNPQDIINERMLQARECDIALFIFWSKMGTELNPDKHVKPEAYQYDVDADELRSQYFSGTESEFVGAMQGAEDDPDKFPRIFVFHKAEPPITTYGINDNDNIIKKQKQLKRLTRFLEYIKHRNKKYLAGSIEKYKKDEDFREQLRDILHEIVVEIAEQAYESCRKRQNERLDDRRRPWSGSPFPGLNAFEEEHERIYFGRSKELVELLSLVRSKRFVAVFGASGAGKSSLVRAGLLPALKRDAITSVEDLEEVGERDRQVASSHWKVITMKPGEVGEEASKNPFEAFSLAVGKVCLNTVSASEIKEEVENPSLELIQINNPENVHALFRPQRERRIAIQNYQQRLATFVESLLANDSEKVEIVLLIDQFEELFTLVNDDSLRQAFILFIQQWAQGNRARVLLTTRADFYHYCLQYEVLTEMFKDSVFNLAPPGLEALSDMICCPAAEADLKFEENVAQRILVDTNTDDNTGALPLMAYLLDQMYIQCRGTGRLTMKAYEEAGGVAGAIARSADQVILELKLKFPNIHKTLHKVFRELVELNDMGAPSRRRASKAKLMIDEPTRQLVNQLIKARLLVTDRQTNKVTGRMEEVAEVAHEALLREWNDLKKWINDNQEDFRLRKKVEEATADWRRRGKSSVHIWSHEQLVPFYEAMERLEYTPDDLDADVIEFIEPEFLRLIRELNLTSTGHRRRYDIGIKLANLDDPRFGVGIDKNNIPQIAWCREPVPAGEVAIEGFDKPFAVNSFYIAKYPVTLAQFTAFVMANDGYKNETWWDKIGQNPREHQVYSQTPATDNHPADRISWYQAIAFCRWLSTKLGFEVRIPYEWEWQQAATGGHLSNLYPWGSDWDSNLCNSPDAKLNTLVAVGLYPVGKSPVGAEDMAGNMVEWCLNTFENPSSPGDFQSNAKRTTRGGAYFLAPPEKNKTAREVVKTTNRLGDDPSAPSLGRAQVSIRLVADYVPEDHLTYPVLNELKGISKSIIDYYVGKDAN